MIVKINVNDGWVFLDDVYNVEIRRHCREIDDHGQPCFVTGSGSKFGADMVVRNAYVTEGNELSHADKEFTVVSCFRNKNNPITYAFNTVGYLLNDSGKTVESI